MVRARVLRGGVVLATAALAVLAGCSSSPVGAARRAAPSATAAVELAATRTVGLKTAAIAMTERVTVDGAAAETLHGSGVVDFTGGDELLELAEQVSQAAMSVKALTVAGQSYLSMSLTGLPAGVQHLMPPFYDGRQWVATPAGADLKSLAASPSIDDPTGILHALAHGGADIRPAGTARIDGVLTHGYHATYSEAALKKDMSGLEAGMSPTLRKVVSLEMGLFKTIETTVWVDASDVVRRMTFDVAGSAMGLGTDVTVDLDFAHFGIPVHLQAPPASQVVSYAAFLHSMSSSLGGALSGLGSSGS